MRCSAEPCTAIPDSPAAKGPPCALAFLSLWTLSPAQLHRHLSQAPVQVLGPSVSGHLAPFTAQFTTEQLHRHHIWSCKIVWKEGRSSEKKKVTVFLLLEYNEGTLRSLSPAGKSLCLFQSLIQTLVPWQDVHKSPQFEINFFSITNS